jgi:CspA family cold shock protein
VELEWERAEQDGFSYRAVRVWPAGKKPVDAEAARGSTWDAYASTLEITWDR